MEQQPGAARGRPSVQGRGVAPGNPQPPCGDLGQPRLFQHRHRGGQPPGEEPPAAGRAADVVGQPVQQVAGVVDPVVGGEQRQGRDGEPGECRAAAGAGCPQSKGARRGREPAGGTDSAVHHRVIGVGEQRPRSALGRHGNRAYGGIEVRHAPVSAATVARAQRRPRISPRFCLSATWRSPRFRRPARSRAPVRTPPPHAAGGHPCVPEYPSERARIRKMPVNASVPRNSAVTGGPATRSPRSGKRRAETERDRRESLYRGVSGPNGRHRPGLRFPRGSRPNSPVKPGRAHGLPPAIVAAVGHAPLTPPTRRFRSAGEPRASQRKHARTGPSAPCSTETQGVSPRGIARFPPALNESARTFPHWAE